MLTQWHPPRASQLSDKKDFALIRTLLTSKDLNKWGKVNKVIVAFGCHSRRQQQIEHFPFTVPRWEARGVSHPPHKKRRVLFFQVSLSISLA